MTETIRAACVMGWPVKQSRSPLIHGYWLKQHGLEGDYRREAVRPEDFADFLAHLAERGYVGGNVTMPHKDMALKLSEPDERALAVGAANTLWLENGTLKSTNTDVEGFIGALDESAPGWDEGLQKAVVMGAGGAARAVAYGFIERDVPRIHVVNRTLSKAEAFRERFGPSVVPTSFDDLPGALEGAGLVANATSLGMEGFPDLEIDLSPMRADAVAADAIYVPLETSLLKTARARGMRTSDGLGMLLHQAGRGFELWFGVRPKVTKELRALVEAELLKQQN
ncbi:MAG: shikimate dehydrogenase [Geminicoccaceae bacterium]